MTRGESEVICAQVRVGLGRAARRDEGKRESMSSGSCLRRRGLGTIGQVLLLRRFLLGAVDIDIKKRLILIMAYSRRQSTVSKIDNTPNHPQTTRLLSTAFQTKETIRLICSWLGFMNFVEYVEWVLE